MNFFQFLFIIIIFNSCNDSVRNIPISNEEFIGKYYFVDKDNSDSLEILSNGDYKHIIVDKKKNTTLVMDSGKWRRTDENQFILNNYRFLNMPNTGIDFRPYFGANNIIYIDMTINGDIKYEKIK